MSPISPYTQLAKRTIQTYLKTGQILEAPLDESLSERIETSGFENLPKEMTGERAGVFVSLHKKPGRSGIDHGLRGCIGTFLPTKKNIAEEIIANAVSAATNDPRFLPVTLEELPSLEISVDVLSKPELVSPCCRQQEVGGYLHLLNPKKYGIFVRNAKGRTGLLLPDIGSIDTIEKQITVACQKAGFNPRHDEFAIYRFTVKRYY